MIVYLRQSMTISSVMCNYKPNYTVYAQTYFKGTPSSHLKNHILQKKKLKSRSSSTNMKTLFKVFLVLMYAKN